MTNHHFASASERIHRISIVSTQENWVFSEAAAAFATKENGAVPDGSVMYFSLSALPGGQILANHQRDPEHNGVVKLPQVKARQLADLLQPVHQGVAVDE